MIWTAHSNLKTPDHLQRGPVERNEFPKDSRSEVCALLSPTIYIHGEILEESYLVAVNLPQTIGRLRFLGSNEPSDTYSFRIETGDSSHAEPVG